MKKIISLLAIVLITVSIVNAQSKEIWKSTFKEDIKWTRITPLGFLIVATPTSLHGVDPATGKITWSNSELSAMDEKSYSDVQGTPFISISNASGDFYLIEPIEGSIAFSTRSVGFSSVVNRFYLYQSSSILVVGLQGERNPVIAMIDMTNGKTRWTKSSDFGMVSACLDLDKDACILTTLFFTYKINVQDGETIWKKSIDPKFEKLAGFMGMLDKGSGAGMFKPEDLVADILLSDKAPGLVFVAAQTKKESTVNGQTSISYTNQYMAFKISDGTYAWEKPIVMNDMLGTVINTPSGLLVCPMSSGNARINLIDYTTGVTSLGKKGRGVTLKGSVLNYTMLEEGMIVNTRILSGSSAKNYIYFLDPVTQEEKFPKPASISGDIQRIIRAGNKLILVSNEELDVYDMASGTFILEKPIKGGINLVADQEGVLYAFNQKDNFLYRLNKKDAGIQQISTTEVKFDGKESPRYIELRQNGIVVSSDQNILFFTYEGMLEFQKYFPAPRLSGLTRALYAAYAIRAAYIGAVSGYASAAFGAASTSIKVEKGDANAAIGKEVTAGLSNVYSQLSNAGFSYAGKAFAAMNTRFKATTESNNSMLIMTETADKKLGLQEVNKDSGNAGMFIDLGKDKEPVYEVDVIDNKIYYRKGTREIVAYGF